MITEEELKTMSSNSTPMEKPQLETLASPSMSSSIHFHRHRKSHLKSRTFRTLVQILSNCYDYSQQSLATLIDEEKLNPDNGRDDLEKSTGEELRDELVVCDSMERDTMPIQEDIVVDESTGVTDIQGGGPNQVQMVMEELEEHIMSGDGNEELVCGNKTNLSTSSVDNKDAGKEIVEVVDCQENISAIEKFLMEESSDLEQLPVDNEHCNLFKAVESSFDQDMVTEVFRQAGSNSEDKLSSFNTDALEDQEMRQKDTELEKSVCTSYKMVSPPQMTGNKEIEEGEISGDLGLFDSDQSVDWHHEDNLAFGNENVDVEQLWDVINKEVASSEKQKGPDQQDTKSTFHNVDRVENMDDNIEVDLTKRNEMECTFKKAVSGQTINDKKVYGYNCQPESGRNKNQGNGSKEEINRPKVCYGDLVSCKEKKADDHGGITSSKKDAGVSNKRKRCGSLETKKEKKKRKKKIKRAEKNRELGVKRLRLQPVLKPKTIKICEFYLKGRCQKGDKCSFSHDAVPLTKSQPCHHFARKSCMKGDDCPFDHQLSKYPCHNFVATGSCIRGDNCMFSHKVAIKDGSTTSGACKPISKPPSMLGSSDIKNQLNSSTSHMNIDTLSCSKGISPYKTTNQNDAETVLKPPAQAPKGISFFSFGKSSLNDSCKLKQKDSSPRRDNVNVGKQINQSAGNLVQSSNEIPKRAPPAVAPRGINFFSFGKAPLDHSSSSNEIPRKTPPAVVPQGINLFSFGKAPLDHSSSEKQTTLPSNSGSVTEVLPLNKTCQLKQISSGTGDISVGHQNKQSAFETSRNIHEMPKSPAVRSPTNPFSFGKSLSDDSSCMQQTSLRSNGGSGAEISPLINSSHSKEIGSVLWRDYSVGNPNNQRASAIIQRMDEMSKSPAVRSPTNPFSFGKSPSDDSSCKQQTTLLSNSGSGTEILPLINSSHLKQIGSDLLRDFSVGNPNNQRASEMIHSMDEMSKRGSPAVASPINPFSFGKSLSDDSSSKQQTSLPVNKDSSIKISVLQRQNAPDKFQYSSATPSVLPVSSHLYSQSSGRLSGGHRNMPISAQKSFLSTLAFAERYESRSIAPPAVSAEDHNVESRS